MVVEIGNGSLLKGNTLLEFIDLDLGCLALTLAIYFSFDLADLDSKNEPW